MTTQVFSNNASAALAASITDVSTSITLTAGQGARFTSPTGTQFELLTLSLGSTIEIVKMTARSTDTLTVVRGQEGTTAVAWASASTIEGRITKETLEKFNQDQASGTDSLAIGAGVISDKSQAVIIGDLAKDDYTSTRANLTAYNALTNTVVTDGAGKAHLCTTSGTTGAAPPTWNTTTGATTVDGTVTWTCVGTDYSAQEHVVGIGYSSKIIGSHGISVGSQSLSNAGGVALGRRAISVGSGVAIGVDTYDLGTYGNTLIGQGSVSAGTEYATAIGSFIINRISHSSIISGFSMIQKAGVGDSGILGVDYSGQETYIFSEVVDLKGAPTDDIVDYEIPSGSVFFPTAVGVIVTAASGVISQPSVSFGITGNTTSILASTPTTKTAVHGKDTFTPISGDGVASLKASLKVAATGTTLSGRFFIKGILVEIT